VKRLDPGADQFKPALDAREAAVDPREPVLDAPEPTLDAPEPVRDVREPTLDSREPSSVILLGVVERWARNSACILPISKSIVALRCASVLTVASSVPTRASMLSRHCCGS
jgi:hypothetical protein